MEFNTSLKIDSIAPDKRTVTSSGYFFKVNELDQERIHSEKIRGKL